jgi:SAM-dependent methyltransferase
LRLAKQYGAVKDGDRLIELGTGWLHWEAITTRLFFDISGILFDVWDNRQLNGLKNYLKQLDSSLEKLDIDAAQRVSAHKLISEICAVNNYEDLYRLIGFEYISDPSGSLDRFAGDSFDVAVSAGVMEHIYANQAPKFVHGISNLLKPGGFSVNSINIRDHIYQYDKSASIKQYLTYPNWFWKACLENDVQYINRIQRSTWLTMFQDAGLALVEEEAGMEDISRLKIANDHRGYSESDLRCGGLDIVHRKV